MVFMKKAKNQFFLVFRDKLFCTSDKFKSGSFTLHNISSKSFCLYLNCKVQIVMIMAVCLKGNLETSVETNEETVISLALR